MSAVTPELSAEQIEQFHDSGYLALEALTTPQELEWLREVYDQLFRERAGREEGNQFDLAGTDEEGKEASLPQILNPAKYAPQLNDSQLLKNVRAIAGQLLGDGAEVGFAHAILKPARSTVPTPWHQDAAYWKPDLLYRTFSAWVPLQDVTREGGCMEFIPGSHRQEEVLPHRSINDDPRVHGLELHPDQMHRVHDAVACPLPAGGGTFHGGYMLHYTAPNRAAVPRRALILGAGLPSRPRPEPRRFPWLEARQTARDARAAKAAAS